MQATFYFCSLKFFNIIRGSLNKLLVDDNKTGNNQIVYYTIMAILFQYIPPN
jgi:hypothetical protein